MATEEQLRQMKERIALGKKKPEVIAQKDLFGEVMEGDIMQWYDKIFHAITKDKNYIWIPGQVVGKKNNYIAYPYYTGKSRCCDAPYDKKTKICTKCGNYTKSAQKTGKIDLNKRAMAYKQDTLPTFGKNKVKFDSKRVSDNFTLVGVFLVRKSKQRFDFDNMKTMIGDQLTTAELINDDSADKLMLIPLGYKVVPKKPGLILKIFNHENYFNFIINECGENK